jgi:hypothetical protein
MYGKIYRIEGDESSTEPSSRLWVHRCHYLCESGLCQDCPIDKEDTWVEEVTNARLKLLFLCSVCWLSCSRSPRRFVGQAVSYIEWVQQSFVHNSVSACFIKHVYYNMFRLKSKPSSSVIVYRILNASYH